MKAWLMLYGAYNKIQLKACFEGYKSGEIEKLLYKENLTADNFDIIKVDPFRYRDYGVHYIAKIYTEDLEEAARQWNHLLKCGFIPFGEGTLWINTVETNSSLAGTLKSLKFYEKMMDRYGFDIYMRHCVGPDVEICLITAKYIHTEDVSQTAWQLLERDRFAKLTPSNVPDRLKEYYKCNQH